jgi:hypothetical protein
MNKKLFFSVILVMVLVFGMTAVGCDNGSTDNGGTLVLTDIPSTYNGKYAYFEARNEDFSVFIVGCQSINMSTETINLVQISNGRVSLPVWIFNESSDSVSRYSGNHTFDNTFGTCGIVIFNTATLTEESESIGEMYFSITFNNGSAEKSVNTGL